MSTKEDVKFNFIECKISKTKHVKTYHCSLFGKEKICMYTYYAYKIEHNTYLVIDVLHSYKNELHTMLCTVTYNTNF